MSSKPSRKKPAARSKPNTRTRVREMTVKALRDRDLSKADIQKLVHESLKGAASTIDHEVPAARRKAMREAFEGLRDAFQSVASAGVNTGKSARRRGEDLANHAVPTARRRIAAANKDFLGAVSSFAKKTSTEFGEELEALVRRAKRAGKQAKESATDAGQKVAKNAAPVAQDLGRASWSLARRAAEQVALAASGLLEGIGQLIAPRKAPAPAKSKAPTKKPARRKPVRKPASK
ncbi:MAG: DUF6781 family protein [Phycisphaerales bacterium]